jgi:5'-3' exonuclease
MTTELLLKNYLNMGENETKNEIMNNNMLFGQEINDCLKTMKFPISNYSKIYDNNNNNSITIKKSLVSMTNSEPNDIKKIITDKNPIIFIDMSFYIFYRFTALCCWYKIHRNAVNKKIIDGTMTGELVPELDIPNIMDNNLFITKFRSLFIEKIMIYRKKIMNQINRKYKTKYTSIQVILGRDCKRANIWRHQICDGYKGNRTSDKKYFNVNIFHYVYNNILPELESNGVWSIFMETAEADDVIGVLKHDIRNNFPTLPMTVITGDADYIQLLDDYTEVIHPDEKKNLRNMCQRDDPELSLCIKILRGDNSDNIPTAIRRSMEISNDSLIDEILKCKYNLMSMSPKFANLKQVKLNKTLIDFREIPFELQENIKKLVVISR